ncbi:PIR protein [Plasmodium ovale]|uniref:PIR protein n=1 Tax=Plasmodium ovale TaxID=36330 RepID=A0A1C3KHY8_PLAOA|nr:PIR protein [Plasmodium ovale]
MKETKYNFVSTLDAYKAMFGSGITDESPLTSEKCKSSCIGDLNNISLNNDCNKAVHYLTKLKENSHLSRQSSCIYLYYWIYKDVLHKNETPNDTEKVYKSFKSVYEEYQDDSEACEIYTEYINKYIFDKIEKLIELHENFDTFQSSPNPTKEEDCIYAKTCYEKYNLHADEFCKDGWNEFCDELYNFKERYDKGMKSITTCGEDIPKTLPSLIGNSTFVFLVPFVMVFLMPLILFILYKFNLLPRWLQTLIRSKKITHDYISQEEHQLHHTSREPKENMKGSPYNLAYHSVEYS